MKEIWDLNQRLAGVYMSDVSPRNGNIFSIDVFSVNQQHLVISLFRLGVCAVVSGHHHHVEPAESKRGQGLFLVGWRYAL